MRVVVFGDIHGNSEALKAVYYNEALHLKTDKVHHVGDMFGWPSIGRGITL